MNHFILLLTFIFTSSSFASQLDFSHFNEVPWTVQNLKTEKSFCQFSPGQVLRLKMYYSAGEAKYFVWEEKVKEGVWIRTSSDRFNAKKISIRKSPPSSSFAFEIEEKTNSISSLHIQTFNNIIYLHPRSKEISEANFKISKEGQYLTFTEHYENINKQMPIQRELVKKCLLKATKY